VIVASDAVPLGIGNNTTERSVLIVALSAAIVLLRAAIALSALASSSLRPTRPGRYQQRSPR
jgi:hypothetical protein